MVFHICIRDAVLWLLGKVVLWRSVIVALSLQYICVEGFETFSHCFVTFLYRASRRRFAFKYNRKQ